MNRYTFELHISPEEYLDYYRGIVTSVMARATNGQTIQFPAALLQRHISPAGIHGTFELTCDDQHKNPSLRRVAPD